MSYLCPSCRSVLTVGVNYKRGFCVRCNLTVDLRYSPSTTFSPPKVSEEAWKPEYNLIAKWVEQQKQEKEKTMKQVFEFVVYNQKEILWEGKVLAKDENQARLLIPDETDLGAEIDFSAEDIEVRIRPFC